MWPLSEAEWTAIAQLLIFLSVVVTFLQSRMNAAATRALDEKTTKQNADSRAAIQEVHLTVNSRLTEFKETSERLLAASIAAAHAEGRAQGEATR